MSDVKRPIAPSIMRMKQYRTKYLIKATFSFICLLAILGIVLFCTSLVWGDADAVFITLITTLVLTSAPIFFCARSLAENVGIAIDAHHSYRLEQNGHAWKAQQEELTRLRTIMKEEGL